jgi:hypothetical protein
METMYLGTRTGQIRAEHDSPRGSIREFLATCLEPVLKEFEVASTTITPLLILDFVLNNEGFRFEVYGCRESSGDGMMCSLAFGNETLVAVYERDRGFLYLPFADVTEGFATDGCLLRCL